MDTMIHLKRRRNQCPKLKIGAKEWKLIEPKLQLRWSPEQIEKWLLTDYPDSSISGRTIYNYVYFHMRGALKKLALKDLRHRRKKRREANVKETRGKLTDITLIAERPLEVNERAVPGHWEGDLLIGKDHQSAICVIVERQTKFIQMDLLHRHGAYTVRKKIEKRFKKLLNRNYVKH